MGQQSGNV
ncbi:hypothetical protein HaLaN_26312 [Haematococcus lacustris]|uniref:Uncharacterized protein n=1 Tax=Haematococcus lacustris TaxID=44745 RepID=A0A6A0A5X4_HAELA|nr:hypothetical protein HaLaN_26312 [Haematococcus lacustris]